MNTHGFGYGIVVSVGIIFLVTTIRLACYFCINWGNIQRRPQQGPRSSRTAGREPALVSIPESFVIDVNVGHGVDEETLKSYPKLLYSEVVQAKEYSTAATITSCCSICLEDYKSIDTLRLLPDCNHVFHLKCVDPWLRLHSTCPVCRTSPIPTPLSTPLAEVTPLSINRPPGG